MHSIFRENTFWSLTFQHSKDYKEFLEKMTADNFLHFAFKHLKGSLHWRNVTEENAQYL
jgi:hypothetical protein